MNALSLLILLFAVCKCTAYSDSLFVHLEGEWIEARYWDVLVQTRSPLRALDENSNSTMSNAHGLTALSFRYNEQSKPEIMALYGMYDSAPLECSGFEKIQGDTFALLGANGKPTGVRLVYAHANATVSPQEKRKCFILGLFEKAPVLSFIFGGKENTSDERIIESLVLEKAVGGIYHDSSNKRVAFAVHKKSVNWQGKGTYRISDWSVGDPFTDCDWIELTPVSGTVQLDTKQRDKTKAATSQIYAYRWVNGELWLYATEDIGGSIHATTKQKAHLIPVPRTKEGWH